MTQQTITANKIYKLTKPHYDGKVGDSYIAIRHSLPDTNLFNTECWLFDCIKGKGLRVIPTSKVAEHV